jgi:hypothetical protein
LFSRGFEKEKEDAMDWKRERMELIRERHRKLILEPRKEIEYPVLEDWDDEPLFDDEMLAEKYAQVGPETEEE